MSFARALLGGLVGYGIGKFLDQTTVGKKVAKVGVGLVSTALTRFNEAMEAAAQQNRNAAAAAAFVPSQPGGNVNEAERYAATLAQSGGGTFR